jgi:hypothetical protein
LGCRSGCQSGENAENLGSRRHGSAISAARLNRSSDAARNLQQGAAEMRSSAQKIAFVGSLLAALIAAQNARANEQPNPADQTPSDAGADDRVNRVGSDAGAGQMPDMAPADAYVPQADSGLADIGDATAQSDAGELAGSTSRPEATHREAREISPARGADVGSGAGPSTQSEGMSVAAMIAPPLPKRLPIFGLMADVGVPDGLIGSLVIRPKKWVRFCAGGGANSISYGWRTGITVLPFGRGPSASLEYGGYQDGNANALAKKLGFNGSPVLDRVGYQYLNAHLGLDFGSRRFVFFIHGGVSVLWGQIHNLDAALAGAGATGTTEVLVRQDPNAKAVGPSVKLGFIGYVW